MTTPRDRMAKLVCFTVEGITPQNLTARVNGRRMTVALVANGRWNLEDEVDAVVAAVGEVAAEQRP